jgi:protein-S-isoprenylcysteine O-methyltransferase Ste14
MSWLLKWSDIRTKKRPAWWDRLLLVITAAFVVVLSLLGALALSVLTDGQKEVWKWTLWVVGGCVYGSLITLLYFTVRRLEAWQPERNIEKYRRDLAGRGSAHTHR